MRLADTLQPRTSPHTSPVLMSTHITMQMPVHSQPTKFHIDITA